MKAVLRSPTLHFLILGLITFILYVSFYKADSNPDTTIIVNRDTLLNYLAFRNRRFDDNSVSEQLDYMEKEELDRLINNFVKDEVLFRQAKQLRLGQYDDVIRQRMIQKITFMNRGILSESLEVSEEDRQRYYEANRARYKEPSRITMAHVYFDSEINGKQHTLERAMNVQKKLNSEHIPFSLGPGHGDRFLYRTSYVKSTIDELASHFGEKLTHTIISIQSNAVEWQGPYESRHGIHLVMLVEKLPERTLTLDEVRDRISMELNQAETEKLEQDAIGKIRSEYTVKVELDPAMSSPTN